MLVSEGVVVRNGSRAALVLACFPAAPVALAAALLGYTLLPWVRSTPGLLWTFSGVAGGVLVWSAILWAAAVRRGQALRVEFAPVRSHYVQACVQLCILAYWGWYVREVYLEAPLILAQIIFLYALEALLTWSRGRTWRVGFGPLPIIFSTNLLLWFKPDWFHYQFLMVALGAMGKQFVTWERDGRRTHIFNPSAFGQSIVALGLILTGTTNDLTWGREIATTFEVPHMLVVIFLVGLVVQYMFHVTLMTVAAAAAIAVLNLVYTGLFGTYFFVTVNVAAPIFLGIHLLVTDPATSPKSNLGRVLFGAAYGLGYAALFRFFDLVGVPLFWDKLLPVPILNLSVPLIDRLARAGLLGRVNAWWERAASPARLNLVHMGCWAGLFATMWGTGFIEAPHPGNSIEFWKRAYADGKPHAGHSLVAALGGRLLSSDALSGPAYNELGLICMEGKIAKQSDARAANFFAQACERGDLNGCRNVAVQFLFRGGARSEADAARALDHLERTCLAGTDKLSCFLVGAAYETGRGRPLNPFRAIFCYERAGNLYAGRGLARIGLTQAGQQYDLRRIAPSLLAAADLGDAESHWYLAYMYETGRGVPHDPRQARAHLQAACGLGLRQACEALELPELPPYRNPVMEVPGWSTAYPID